MYNAYVNVYVLDVLMSVFFWYKSVLGHAGNMYVCVCACQIKNLIIYKWILCQGMSTKCREGSMQNLGVVNGPNQVSSDLTKFDVT